MKNSYFQALENLENKTTLALDDVIERLAFNHDGLIPIVTQDADTLEVLMLAWMNQASIYKALAKGRMVYWSRSRQEFWEKGATSGHVQKLTAMSFDCDGDAMLCKVNQTGAACHTGRKHCFHLEVTGNQHIQILGNAST